MEYYRENNKLIAEFMGWDVKNPTTIPTNLHLSNLELDNGEVMELKFHEERRWLMPVSQKIDKYFGSCLYLKAYLDDCLLSNDIDVRYQAVVEFIKAYNKNKEE